MGKAGWEGSQARTVRTDWLGQSPSDDGGRPMNRSSFVICGVRGKIQRQSPCSKLIRPLEMGMGKPGAEHRAESWPGGKAPGRAHVS